jgi:hypothetical protein
MDAYGTVSSSMKVDRHDHFSGEATLIGSLIAVMERLMIVTAMTAAVTITSPRSSATSVLSCKLQLRHHHQMERSAHSCKIITSEIPIDSRHESISDLVPIHPRSLRPQRSNSCHHLDRKVGRNPKTVLSASCY